VSKRREIYLWHNVRIHPDAVTGLGSFVEFEAVFGRASSALFFSFVAFAAA
jgi:adenylate cyclase class IV